VAPHWLVKIGTSSSRAYLVRTLTDEVDVLIKMITVKSVYIFMSCQKYMIRTTYFLMYILEYCFPNNLQMPWKWVTFWVDVM